MNPLSLSEQLAEKIKALENTQENLANISFHLDRIQETPLAVDISKEMKSITEKVNALIAKNNEKLKTASKYLN